MKNLNLYILTFNCARTRVQPEILGTYLFDAIPQAQRTILPDIIVLSLQEIAPLGYSFLGGSFITPYFDALRQAVKIATHGTPYVNVLARNVGMTAIMVFSKEDIISKIAYTKTAGVGVGLQSMGNKGAVGVKLGLETDELGANVMEVTFVAAHLAPMEDGLQQRNEDWKSIVQGLVFVDDKAGKAIGQDEGEEDAPLLQGNTSSHSLASSGLLSPQSHLFFAGDLNYRISSTKPNPEDYKQYPTPTAPIGHPLHFSSFLERDQLSNERLAGRTLHGLTEAPITFPPTYKYSTNPRVPAQVDNNLETWDWSKHRWPSWCDRILYLELPRWMQAQIPQAAIKVNGYTALPLFLTSDHRPVGFSVTLPWVAIPPPPEDAEDVRLSPPFELDPDWRSKRAVARKKEILVGVLAYLALTWEGNGLLAASVIGAVGGFFIIKSLIVV